MAVGRSSDEGEAAGLPAEEMVLESWGKGRSGWSEARGREWKGGLSARSTVMICPVPWLLGKNQVSRSTVWRVDHVLAGAGDSSRMR